MSNINFTIGCDPEVFVREKATSRLVSAAGLIPGDKANPHKVPDGAVQVDGLALELNTDPVSLDEGFKAFDKKLISVLGTLAKMVPDHRLTYEGSVVFDKDYYDKEVPEDAKELGCDPDFNAYKGGEKNPTPDGDTTMRGAAGHIHIGWGQDIPFDHPDHIAICCDFIKCLDAYVGLATTLFESPAALARKKAYGKAGAFRPKSYGVEYRTPSNEWLNHIERRKLIFECVSLAVKAMQAGEGATWRVYAKKYGVNYEEIINNPTGFPITPEMKAAFGGYTSNRKKLAAYILWNFGVRTALVSTTLNS